MISGFQQRVFVAAMLGFIASSLPAQNAHRELLRGDRAYRQNDYPEAAQNYRRSELKLPGLQSWYNLGNTLYQQKNYEEAAGYFRRAAEAASDPAHRARAFHNLGNAQYQQGDYAGAVESYKQALRLNPGDPDTRNNLNMAMQEQQAQGGKSKEQDGNGKGQDGNGKGQEANGKPAGDSTENPQPTTGSEKGQSNIEYRTDEDRTDEDRTGEDRTGEDRTDEDRTGENQTGENGTPKPMNKSEAEKLLQIMSREEQKVQQRLRRATSAPPKSSKDW